MRMPVQPVQQRVCSRPVGKMKTWFRPVGWIYLGILIRPLRKMRICILGLKNDWLFSPNFKITLSGILFFKKENKTVELNSLIYLLLLWMQCNTMQCNAMHGSKITNPDPHNDSKGTSNIYMFIWYFFFKYGCFFSTTSFFSICFDNITYHAQTKKK